MHESASQSLSFADPDLRELNGRVVLVTSARDHRNPPAGRRGWLEVHEGSGEEPTATLVVEFPQMFTSTAHHRIIPLNQSDLARLLASEWRGAWRRANERPSALR